MRIDIAAQTDIGRRKKANEDYFAVCRDDTEGLQLFDKGTLLCVADGLGGHVGGTGASCRPCRVRTFCVEADPSTGSDRPGWGRRRLVVLPARGAVRKARTGRHQWTQVSYRLRDRGLGAIPRFLADTLLGQPQ